MLPPDLAARARPFASLAAAALLAVTPALAQTCPAPIGVPMAPWNSLFMALDHHGGPLYFIGGVNSTTGRELWRWDAAGGVAQLSDQAGALDGANGYPVVLWVDGERRVFFNGRSGPTGYEPFVSDGTPAGTGLLKDVKPGMSSSKPRDFVAVGGIAYFSAETLSGRLLIKSDGTMEGTKLVKGVAAGGPIGPVSLTPFGERLLFGGYREATGKEPWISDGTLAGTVALGDLNPGFPASNPWDFTALGDRAVFTAETDLLGRELYVTDGTPAGTGLLKEFAPGVADSFSDFSPQGFVVWRGEVYFGADDGVHGFELWKTDGTPAGTQLVLDLTPGPASSSLGNLVAVGDVLFFANDTSAALGGVWTLDAGGAVAQLGTLDPEFVFGGAAPLVPAEGGVYYAGKSAAAGTELVFADASGTAVVCDLFPGAGSSQPTALQLVGDRLLMTASTPAGGAQPHWLAVGGPHARDLGFGGPLLRLEGGAPALGSAVSVRVDGNAPGALAFVAFSAQQGPAPDLVAQGAARWLDAATVRTVAYFTTATLATTYGLPSDPGLAGVRANVQAFGVPQTVFPLHASNGVALILGP